ncbi:MAG: MBOAT family O-acyltransferase [Gammaproteobacteria bacterium]
MVFNSLTFMVFLAVVLVLHNAPLNWPTKKFNLLLASYIFYAAWNPPFVILLWISTVVDWYAAKWIHREERSDRRRWLLLISLTANLGLLGFFKYGEFLLDNFIVLAATLGIAYQPAPWDIILPVGISFYTFQTMAYTLDVYLRRAAPARSFTDFALFVTFFPQLVAGPIVRPDQLIPQFAEPRRASPAQFLWGAGLVTLGMFNKIVVADGLLAPVADAVFGATTVLHPLDAWLGTLAFSGQIFCDFAGYSTIAIGVALMLGFSLPDNFRFPYAAIGFSDFWRRWHISLSTWLRDYLYVPLGGNRKGVARTYVNLMLTMLLGGLWHGAAWTFVVWGGLHGLYLAAERWLKGRFGGITYWQTLPARVFLALLTYFLVNITWVFFRAQDFGTARRMIDTMLTFETAGQKVLTSMQITSTVLTIGAMLIIHWTMRNRTLHDVIARLPAPAAGVTAGLIAWLVVITQGGGNAFIYFQF